MSMLITPIGYGFDDFRDLTKTMLELVFYIISLHYTMFKEFKTSQHSFVEGEAISNKAKISKLWRLGLKINFFF